MIRPKTAKEVSAAVRFATANALRFVVRGGGHNPSGESAAPTPEAVVIDLSLMRTVEVDLVGQTVTFAGGCLWAEVDRALWEHGLATVGGTVSHTGVGGLILGGGQGLLTGQRGMAVDILVSCQVVLANGEIVTASETEHPDLFWALRGAGSSFGVVTSFTERVFPQGLVWSGLLMWPHSDEVADTVVAFINQFHEQNDGRQWSMAIATLDPVSGGRVVGAGVFYDGPVEQAQEFFAPLLKLQPQLLNNTRQRTYPEANSVLDPLAPHGRRYMFGGANYGYPVEPQFFRNITDSFYEQLSQPGNEDLRSSVLALELFPQKKVVEYGKLNKTAFSGRQGRYNAVMLMSWDSEASDAAAYKVVDAVGPIFRAKEMIDPDGPANTYYNVLSEFFFFFPSCLRLYSQAFGDSHSFHV